jgi:hypothetical protein
MRRNQHRKMLRHEYIVLVVGMFGLFYQCKQAEAQANNWPDMIICEFETLPDVKAKGTVTLFRSRDIESDTAGCPALSIASGSSVDADFRSVHGHAHTMKGELIVESEFQMRFCGRSIDNATAYLASKYLKNCKAGETMSQLIARGQTRSFAK